MELVNTFKILSDETRIRILHLLEKQDLCVCELTELLDLPQPKISKHIAKIRNEKLVQTIRKEQYIYYSLNRSNTGLMNILKVINDETNEVLKNDLIKLQNKSSFVCK